MLLEQPGVDVNIVGNNGFPLLNACKYGYVDIVRMLLSCPDINVLQVHKGEYALQAACAKGNEEIVKMLLEKHDNEFGLADMTEIFEACNHGFLNIVKILIQYPNICINKMTPKGSPLIVACQKGYIDIVKVLLEHPDIDVDASNGVLFRLIMFYLFLICFHY